MGKQPPRMECQASRAGRSVREGPVKDTGKGLQGRGGEEIHLHQPRELWVTQWEQSTGSPAAKAEGRDEKGALSTELSSNIMDSFDKELHRSDWVEI